MPSEAQKKASAKWTKENMATLSCKLKKEQAEEFRAKCRENNTTVNKALQDFVLGYISGTKD